MVIVLRTEPERIINLYVQDFDPGPVIMHSDQTHVPSQKLEESLAFILTCPCSVVSDFLLLVAVESGPVDKGPVAHSFTGVGPEALTVSSSGIPDEVGWCGARSACQPSGF